MLIIKCFQKGWTFLPGITGRPLFTMMLIFFPFSNINITLQWVDWLFVWTTDSVTCLSVHLTSLCPVCNIDKLQSPPGKLLVNSIEETPWWWDTYLLLLRFSRSINFEKNISGSNDTSDGTEILSLETFLPMLSFEINVRVQSSSMDIN